MLRALRYILRKFYLLLALLIIVLAVTVQLGRNLSYLLVDYREDIAKILSEQTQTLVSMDSVNAQWDGLQPSIIAEGIRIEGRPGVLLAQMQRAQLRLDLLASVLALQPVWSNVALSGGYITVDQNDEGRWYLQGAPETSASSLPQDGNNKLIDILLAARRISFEDTQLNLSFNSGDTITLLSPNVLVENRDDFHRLLVNVDVADNRNALFFLLESRGDPRDIDSAVSAYLQLRDFPLSAPADVLSTQFVSEYLRKGDLTGRLDASVWVTREKRQRTFDVAGDLALANASLPLGYAQLEVEKLSTDVSGRIVDVSHWQVGASSLFLSAMGRSQTDMQVAIAKAGRVAPLSVQLDTLDLAWFNGLLIDGGFFAPAGRLEHLAQSLDVTGQLHNIALLLPTQQPELWQLSAYADQISVGNWNDAPGATGVSGYITANARQGVVQLDSSENFSLTFDKVYGVPMHFDTASGQVSWLLRKEQNKIDVFSGRIHASEGDENLQGQFHLSLPYQRNSGPIHLTISATAQNVAAKQYKKYVPQVVPDTLLDYLEQGVGNDNAGVASHAEFIYRGIVNEHGPQAHNVALDMELSQASFHYQDNWPDVHDVTGRLVVDNSDVHARIESARIYNSRVSDARITLSDNPLDDGSLLEVSGKVDGIASDGLRILRQSVLREFVGEQMDTWFLHGDMQAALDIAVPLTPGAQGGRHSVVLDIGASSFDLDNLALALDDFSGRISYDDQNGIQASNLHATLFEQPLQLAIRSDKKDAGLVTVIDAQGAANAEHIAHWSRQPALLFVEGLLPFCVTVELNHTAAQQAGSQGADVRQAAVAVEADLSNARVELPAPLAKAEGDAGKVIVNYIMGSETTFADVHYLDRVRAMLHLEQGSHSLLNGAVGIGVEPVFPMAQGLHISGEVGSVEVGAWQEVLSRYRAHEREVLGDVSPQLASTSLPISTDLIIQRQALGPLALTDVRVRAMQLDDGWDFLVNNTALNGELFWPTDAARPLRINLSTLDIPAELMESKEADKPWQLTGTGSWPSADVTVASLLLAGEDYGNWSFRFQPTVDALNFEQITGAIRGIDVTGDGAGASLHWQLGEEPATELNALLQVPSMAHTLEAWGAAPSLEADGASYDLALTWMGTPADVGLAKLNGELKVDIGQGRYLRGNSGAGDGLLKFLGLFNFDSLARRARLDFSDLYKSGLAFDGITGRVAFEEGLMSVVEPIQLQSPSSRMELTGQVDLIGQTMDTRLLATLPMTGNLTVITALAAGLPAAAGVFVISKLFEEQMNKMTSVRYAITGDWDAPATEFLGVADTGSDQEPQ